MIRVRSETKEELKELGTKKDTYDTVISELIKERKKGFDIAHQKKIVTNYHSLLTYMNKEYWIFCQMCMKNRSVEVHHKDANHNNNILENMLLVCKSCHTNIHKKISKWKRCYKKEYSKEEYILIQKMKQ